jgi:hypothetical protein
MLLNSKNPLILAGLDQYKDSLSVVNPLDSGF